MCRKVQSTKKKKKKNAWWKRRGKNETTPWRWELEFFSRSITLWIRGFIRGYSKWKFSPVDSASMHCFVHTALTLIGFLRFYLNPFSLRPDRTVRLTGRKRPMSRSVSRSSVCISVLPPLSLSRSVSHIRFLSLACYVYISFIFYLLICLHHCCCFVALVVLFSWIWSLFVNYRFINFFNFHFFAPVVFHYYLFHFRSSHSVFYCDYYWYCIGLYTSIRMFHLECLSSAVATAEMWVSLCANM